MTFRVESEIFERFPDLKLGILVLEDINNTLASDELEH